MTAYKNFISDFPSRCIGLLDLFESKAARNDCEVTLLLAIACAGLVIPLERIDNERHTERQPLSPETQCKWDKIKCKAFLSSDLWKSDADSWKYGQLSSICGDPDNWAELQNASSMPALRETSQVSCILRHLRNSLSHGNIYTRDCDHKIETLVFVATHGDPKLDNPDWWFITCTPSDFAKFIRKWVKFLSSLELSASLMPSELSLV